MKCENLHRTLVFWLCVVVPVLCGLPLYTWIHNHLPVCVGLWVFTYQSVV